MDSNTENTKDENIIEQVHARYGTYPADYVRVYGSLAGCHYENFPDSVSIKIFNPSGKLVLSDESSISKGSCWYEIEIAVNSSELISG